MIGDLLPTLAKAQGDSIAQIQSSIQDGVIPAYIGIPLLQQKLQQRQEAQALLMGRQQQGQPPIAQQVMQQANQITQPQRAPQMPQMPPQQMAQAPQGIESAPSNLPQKYAGGGIVAFADNPNQPVRADMSASDSYDPMGTGAGEIMQSAQAPYGRSFFQWLSREPEWKAKLAAEQAAKAKATPPTAPTAEPKKDTGIVIHDTKPAKAPAAPSAPAPAPSAHPLAA